MNRDLLIVGAGPMGRVALEIAQAVNVFGKIDFLDDREGIAVGGLREYEELSIKYSYGFVALSDADMRLAWIQRLQEACYTVVSLVHPSAQISPSAHIYEGSLVQANVVVNTGALLGKGCVLGIGALVDYGCLIGDGSCLETGAVIKPYTILYAKTRVYAQTARQETATDSDSEWIRHYIEENGEPPSFF